MMSIIKKIHYSRINRITNDYLWKKSKNNLVKFDPCPRDICYCLELIKRPDKTKITIKLIQNANKCKNEYFIVKYIK